MRDREFMLPLGRSLERKNLILFDEIGFSDFVSN